MDEKDYDLVIAIDVLEHLEYDQLDTVINNLIKITDTWILISVPTLTDPNLMKDKTHRIFENKEWWVEKCTSKGLEHFPTPEHWLYKEQMSIFKKGKEENNG